jgi:hypothetical protein
MGVYTLSYQASSNPDFHNMSGIIHRLSTRIGGSGEKRGRKLWRTTGGPLASIIARI